MNDKIKVGLGTLLNLDHYLLENNLNERSITHRLGIYYQAIFQDWDVDCEYNKNLNKPKGIDIDPYFFLTQMADLLEADKRISRHNDFISKVRKGVNIEIEDLNFLVEQLRDEERIKYDIEFDVIYFVLSLRDGRELYKLIYPDIIIHKRGTTNNHIVIETKRSENHNELSRIYDMVKLRTLVNHPNYKYKRGYFIDIPTGQDFINYKNQKQKITIKKEPADDKVYKVESSSVP